MSDLFPAPPQPPRASAKLTGWFERQSEPDTEPRVTLSRPYPLERGWSVQRGYEWWRD
jgi:hypothetical protein